MVRQSHSYKKSQSAFPRRDAKPAEYYRKLLTKASAPKPVHALKTKEDMSIITQRWKEHCEFLEVDHRQHLELAGKEQAMVFFRWLLDHRRTIKKRSTLNWYKRVWLMVYRKSTGRDFPTEESEHLQNFIMGLSEEYKLVIEDKEKPVLNADGMYLILHHHWVHDRSIFPHERQRVQLALMLLIQTYTATRPGVLTYKPTNPTRIAAHYVGQELENDLEVTPSEEQEFKALTYKDVKLFLLPNPGGVKDVLVMEITLRYTKGWNRKPIPKTFILYEVDDLIFDPTILMVAIAILDEAFEANIKSVHDLYKIRVPPARRSLEFTWKTSMFNTPIFRQPDNKSTSSETSPNQPIRYNTYMEYLKRLGVDCGFMQILKTYMIRRGAGEAIEAVATQGQLQQVMNHQNAGIYQAYINQRVQVDTISALIGRPSKKALMKAATHMSRYIDSRAPRGASSEDLRHIGSEYEIEEMIKAKDTFLKLAIRESGTIKKAKANKTELYTIYQAMVIKVKSTQQTIKQKAAERTRNRYFEEINTREINSQINSVDSNIATDTHRTTNRPVYQLEERKILSQIIIIDAHNLDERAKTDQRLATADILVQLGRTKEIRQRPIKEDNRNVDKTSSHIPGNCFNNSIPSIQTGTVCERTQYFLYFWANGRRSHFSSVYKTRNHIKSHHLRKIAEGSEFHYPEPGCKDKGVRVEGINGFKNHLATSHCYDIFNERTS